MFNIEAIQKHSDLVKKYLGSVIPLSDHFFATLNSTVFTDGSFVYIPLIQDVQWNFQHILELMHQKPGQFERTLIIADKGQLS